MGWLLVAWIVGVIVVLILTNPEIMGIKWINDYVGLWAHENTARHFAAVFWFLTVPAFIIVMIAALTVIPWIFGGDDENNYMG